MQLSPLVATFVGLTQDRVNAVIALESPRIPSRVPLIAGRKADISEVVAPRALQQVSTGCRHITQLRRSATEQRLR